MGLYAKWLLPRLTHVAMGMKEFGPYRARALAAARGRVLELGIGSGRNLPFYGPDVRSLTGVDPSVGLTDMARRAAHRARFPVDFLVQSAEQLSLEDQSVDTAVSTWTLCTIPDPVKALREVRRVLKPEGRLLFAEHGRAPEPEVVAWQERLTPVWKHCAGGCHLDRKVDDLLRAAGFELEALHTGYAKGPRPMAYMYEGVARPA
jgi:ubiquinone/menaquinone biosynthesis C-methylase UbiE